MRVVNLDKASQVFNGIVGKMDNVVDNMETLTSKVELKPVEPNVTPVVQDIK